MRKDSLSCNNDQIRINMNRYYIHPLENIQTNIALAYLSTNYVYRTTVSHVIPSAEQVWELLNCVVYSVTGQCMHIQRKWINMLNGWRAIQRDRVLVQAITVRLNISTAFPCKKLEHGSAWSNALVRNYWYLEYFYGHFKMSEFVNTPWGAARQHIQNFHKDSEETPKHVLSRNLIYTINVCTQDKETVLHKKSTTKTLQQNIVNE